MSQRLFACMLPTSQVARRIRDNLVAIGIADSDIAIVGAEQGAAELSWSELNRFWSRASDRGLVEDDRSLYLDGIREGASLLVAMVPEALASQAVEAIEHGESVNLRQKPAGWRQGSLFPADMAETEHSSAAPFRSTEHGGPDATLSPVRGETSGVAGHDTQGYSIGPSSPLAQTGARVASQAPIEDQHHVPAGHLAQLPDARNASHDTAGFSLGPDKRTLDKGPALERSVEAGSASWLADGRVRSYAALSSDS